MRKKGKRDIEKIAASFADLISSFKERKMQRVLLTERMKKLDTDTVCHLLHYFVMKSEGSDIKFKPVISCLLDVQYLVSSLGNAKMSEIYTRLEEMGYNNVMALLVPHPHLRRGAHEDDIISFPDMEELPLGIKKTLAKSDKRHTLDKLIYENDHMVIRNLLNNPRITERDVLKVVTRRPVKKIILMEVVNNKKWISRYVVKKAIIRNPFSPTDIALNLMHFMLRQDLKLIANDGRLHYSVRESAKIMMKKKNEYEEEE